MHCASSSMLRVNEKQGRKSVFLPENEMRRSSLGCAKVMFCLFDMNYHSRCIQDANMTYFSMTPGSEIILMHPVGPVFALPLITCK